MLAVVIAAALSPNTGVVQAQTNAQYNQSPSSTVSPYLYVGIGVAVALAALLVALLLMGRRRRRPPSPPPPQLWQGGPSAPASAAAVAPPPPSPPPASPPPPAAGPAYLETPEDVGQAAQAGPIVGAGVGAGAAGAGAEAEPDIDSLMAELDKISGEILKRAPKKGAGSVPADEGAGATGNR